MTALVWLLLTASSGLVVRGQEQATRPDGMLLSALQGHRYERVTYDAKGKLTDRAVLVIGRITMDAGEMSVPLNVDVYKNDAVERRFSSTWTCAPEAGAMMMSVLVFGADADKPRLQLETTGAPLAYPAQVPPSGTLPDVSVEVKVKQGFLRFLGARSRITFSDRRIAATTGALNGESAKGAYSITSRVEFRAYAWGVRVRRTRFRSEETVGPEQGLLQHVLRREDGGYSALRRLSPTSGELKDGPTSLHSASTRTARRSVRPAGANLTNLVPVFLGIGRGHRRADRERDLWHHDRWWATAGSFNV